MNEDPNPAPVNEGPQWQPLDAKQRRVLGVLVEKAKTVPESYPMTLNSIKNASNQKSNRFPQMDMDEEDVDDALESLKPLKVITEIIGDSRARKFRHHMYQWMGVEKAELAVITELLLRGAQTVGELRARAARMEPIAGMTELRPVLDALLSKKLIVYLTPPGRGCMLTHNLYQPKELERIRNEHGGYTGSTTPQAAAAIAPAPRPLETAPSLVEATPTSTPAPHAAESSDDSAAFASLRAELAACRAEIAALRGEMEQTSERLRGDLDDLCRQLGV